MLCHRKQIPAAQSKLRGAKNRVPPECWRVARLAIHAILWSILLVLFFEGTAFSQSEGLLTEDVKIPKLLKRVTDFTNSLSSSELGALEQDIARFEDSTSTQLAVVMIPTIGSESLEDFSLRTAQTNAIGQKNKNNGVLLLVAKDDRKIRIEVGYGLEGVLTDALSGQIIRREITPYFRSGDYYAGIKAGTEAIMLATRNEYKAEAKEKSQSFSWIIPVLFFALFIYVMINGARRSRNWARAGFPIYTGGLGRSRGESWGGGGGGGGGFGGFSGGGGSFGGGGASGSW